MNLLYDTMVPFRSVCFAAFRKKVLHTSNVSDLLVYHFLVRSIAGNKNTHFQNKTMIVLQIESLPSLKYMLRWI